MRSQLPKALRVYQSPGTSGNAQVSASKQWALGKSACNTSSSVMFKVGYFAVPGL